MRDTPVQHSGSDEQEATELPELYPRQNSRHGGNRSAGVGRDDEGHPTIHR